MNPLIVLIMPPSSCVEDDHLEPPLGLLYIASYLIDNGLNNILIYDMTGCKTPEEIQEKVSQIPEARFYGITCYSTNYNYVKQIINFINTNYKNVYTIVGGPHPTALPWFTLKDLNVDAVITNEGEITFCDLVKNQILRNEKKQGLFFGEYLNNIDDYPFPARNLINYNNYSRRMANDKVASLISSRGCTNKCLHCNSNIMGGGSKSVRYRSSDNIVSEIALLSTQFKYFRFNDDNFSGNPNLHDLLSEIGNLKIKFRAFARLEDLTEKTCILLREAGCIHISIGLESLDPKNLKILGKGNQIGKTENIQFAKENNITVRAFFMVGLPFDSHKSIEMYFKRASATGIDEFAIYPLIPYPGTRISRDYSKYGYSIVNNNFTDYVQMGKNGKTCFALQHKNFTADNVREFMEIASSALLINGVKHMSNSEITN